jgi:hypothetical protein
MYWGKDAEKVMRGEENELQLGFGLATSAVF